VAGGRLQVATPPKVRVNFTGNNAASTVEDTRANLALIGLLNRRSVLARGGPLHLKCAGWSVPSPARSRWQFKESSNVADEPGPRAWSAVPAVEVFSLHQWPGLPVKGAWVKGRTSIVPGNGAKHRIGVDPVAYRCVKKAPPAS